MIQMEVHIVGELEGASGFPSASLFCKWSIVSDPKNWEVLSATQSEGQTQVDWPKVSGDIPSQLYRNHNSWNGKLNRLSNRDCFYLL